MPNSTFDQIISADNPNVSDIPSSSSQKAFIDDLFLGILEITEFF